MLVKVTHSPWRIPDGREKKKSPYKQLRGTWFRSCFSRAVAYSRTVDVITIIILSIIEYSLLFSIFRYKIVLLELI